jgi:hypothetical protein
VKSSKDFRANFQGLHISGEGQGEGGSSVWRQGSDLKDITADEAGYKVVEGIIVVA